jgi:multisubunit Na+/H+ antiporter MnhB subunit
MIFILAQKQLVAENRSILLASLILIYMILLGIYIFLFGHELLNSIKIF